MVFFLSDSAKLEECEDISYLGITLNNNGSFIKAKNKLVQQAQKVYILFIEKCKMCVHLLIYN